MTGLVAITLAACSSPASSRTATKVNAPAPTSPAAVITTLNRTFAPFDSAGRLIAPTSTRLSGNCWTSSIALPSTHTYRCMAGNQILDPCFAPPVPARPSTVACFTDPWTPGVVLTLTAPLQTNEPGSREDPWALQLTDGTRCVVLTGTVDQVGALDLEYRCGAGEAGTGEAGLVNPGAHGAVLQVEYRASNNQPLHLVTVATAWRG